MKIYLTTILFLAIASFAFADSDKIIFQNDFEKADLNHVPSGFLVLDGDFAVKQSDGNKYLELPGAPLDTFGVLFGSTTNQGVCVGARIYGTKKGRRDPSFGVGLNGVAGYKLKVSPAKGELEIYKGDESVANVPFDWKSGSWTIFRMRVHQAAPDDWKIEGKAWVQTDAEPKDWLISLDEKTAPHSGRASVWGSPISGTPIRFDDLVITTE
jgi:hypothetical protein